MSVPSKSKKAPTDGPSGLCSTSSTSSSMGSSVVGDRDGALGAVGRGQARLVEEVVGDVVDQAHAVALVVGLEHLGGQHVAAPVSGARVAVDVQLHLAESPVGRSVGHRRSHLRSAPMNLGLTDDQQFFQETTRKFLEQEAPITSVRALADDPGGFDRAWWSRGAELGWASFLVPEDDGGGSLSGDGVVDLAIVAEEMGRLVSPGPLVPTNVVADAVARGGSAELRAEVLPAIVAGELVAAWCIAGPGGGWDAHGVAVAATPDGDGVVLEGVSTPVECAAQADELLVTARTDGGLTQCLVPASTTGVHVEAVESVDLVRRFATVHLDGVRVPADRVVGEIGGAADAVER